MCLQTASYLVTLECFLVIFFTIIYYLAVPDMKLARTTVYHQGS